MVTEYLFRVFLYLLLIVAGSLHAKVIHVVEDKGVLNVKQQMVVKFAASWCSTCQHIAEPFEAISDEAEFQHILFAHVDIERHEEISKQHGVIGVPTFAYLDNGSKKGQEIGAKDLNAFKDHLRGSIRSHFNMPAVETRLAAVAHEELDPQKLSGNDAPILTWVWERICHVVDDLTQALKNIFV